MRSKWGHSPGTRRLSDAEGGFDRRLDAGPAERTQKIIMIPVLSVLRWLARVLRSKK